ncbi:GNAT family N-acetyltransferase [Taibaiella helva]|uniref:GNAT family N-acetyltransferase n=1 Tax=Taibaiella helva TaxID=2301235 RepID=UPI000E5725EE|nr:GNAT family N-acetyltransferase [Taibaiella helva]
MIPNIHEASPLEIEVIRSLIGNIWKPTYREILSEDQMDYMLERMYDTSTLQRQMQQGHVFLILSAGQAPLGFAGFEYDYPETGTCKLHKIYLLPETQGKGMGKMLLNAVAEKAAARGQRRLLLNVNRYNKALDFYRHYGFEIVGEEDIDIGNGYFMNDYQMALPLKDRFPAHSDKEKHKSLSS